MASNTWNVSIAARFSRPKTWNPSPWRKKKSSPPVPSRLGPARPVEPPSPYPFYAIAWGMHDLFYFRSTFDRIAERLATRGPMPQLDQFRELDQNRRKAIAESEQT